MRIGLFCNEYPPRPHGGIGTFVREIGRGLVEAGQEVTVVELGSREGTWEAEGVRVVTLPEIRTRGIAWLANRLRLAGWLWWAARRGNIDLFEIPEFQGWLPFPGEPCPVIVRLHLSQSHIQAIISNGAVNRGMFWLERQTLRWHRYWIGVSRYILQAEQDFFRCRPRRSCVIYNPVPLPYGWQPSEPDPGDSRFFLFVGSVSERKGALVLAEAAAPLLAEDPKLELVYIGAETSYEGRPISQEIRRRVGAKLADRVHFLGWIPHESVLEWMARAIALVLPSRVEAFPLVVVEAMAVGTPVVISEAGPGPELVEDGVTGLLVDPGDAENVRRALRRVRADYNYARGLGAAAKEMVKGRFSLRACVEETLAFYQQALSTSKRQGSARLVML
jgi:glycosyltransferase involved in cell wall biosynthesis